MVTGWTPDCIRPCVHDRLWRRAGDSNQSVIVNSDGSSPRRLTSYVLDGRNTAIAGFSWSPDGTRLVFSNAQDLYSIRPDGSNLVNLTESPSEYEYDPIWSPDGTRILFRGLVGAVLDLFVIDPNGDNRLNLTKTLDPTGLYYDMAAWQP